MRVLVTGASNGIGRATVRKFLREGFDVVGIDILKTDIQDDRYSHIIADVSVLGSLPRLAAFDIVVNNAGTVDEHDSIQVNLGGYINIVEKYCNHSRLRALVNIASISGHVGLDSARYSASQGARLAYSKHLAQQLGRLYGTRVNTISPGAVVTSLEPELYANKEAMKAVAEESILKKWIRPSEIAEWIYFISVVDKSMTGQDVVVDNGEMANYNFISVK